ncbi:MAG: hypothetical protein KIT27_09790 [Legionellales bacterium]|nr:hypothetical protein [Legionellales bacterium]
MKQKLLVTLYTTGEPTIISQVCRLIADNGGNIVESRLSDLDSDQVFTAIIAGTWDAIAKTEAGLIHFCQRHALPILHKRSEPKEYTEHYLNYQMQAIGVDEPGILSRLVDYFVEQNIPIQELFTTNFLSTPSMTPTMSITMSLLVPVSVLISSLRENFFEYCESYNLDALLEPEKL